MKKVNVGDKTLTTNEEEDYVTVNKIYSYMHNEHIFSVFSNIEIAMRIFLSMMVTNVCGERSFSKMMLLKDELRNSMAQSRLNYLSLMSIEHDILENVNFDSIIHDFATSKCRKVNL